MSYPIYVEGRRIYLRTGARTQTVNVCTDDNQAGSYDVVYRLHGMRVTADQLRLLPTLGALETWLHRLGAVDEGPRRHTYRPVPPPVASAPSMMGRSTPPATSPPALTVPAGLAARRVLVLGRPSVVTARVQERIVALGGEVAANLTRKVTDVVCLPEVADDDGRRLRALSWGLPVLTRSDLTLLESGLVPMPWRQQPPVRAARSA